MGTVSAALQPIDVSIRQLSDGNPGGTVLGTGPTDNIGFYGDTAPGPQPSGAAQSALLRGVAFGTIATQATSQSPAAVVSNAATEVTLTIMPNVTGAFFQAASTDFIYVQKPTSQAGIGIGNVRPTSTANQIGVTFSNPTNTSVTPTAAEKYGVVVIRGLPTLTASLTPAAVSAQTIVEQQFAVPGLRAGELVQVSKPTAQTGLNIVGCRVVSANLLGITFENAQLTTPVTPTAAETYTILSLGGLDGVSNNIAIEAPAGILVTVATTTTAEQAVTITGLTTSDFITGVSKPTAQAGLGVVGWRVSGTNIAGITFMNGTGAAITPTSSEVYGVQIFRPNPVAPLVVYNPTLAPTGVAALTTAEQIFTVTGVLANSVAWVNKPSAQNGLGIAGVRATTNANQIGITFINGSAATITPATEAYVVGNFQQAIPDAGAGFVYQMSPQQQNNVVLTNAIRNALAGNVGLNLIAGV